jgi:hypothetical protein
VWIQSCEVTSKGRGGMARFFGPVWDLQTLYPL